MASSLLGKYFFRQKGICPKMYVSKSADTKVIGCNLGRIESGPPAPIKVVRKLGNPTNNKGSFLLYVSHLILCVPSHFMSPIKVTFSR